MDILSEDRGSECQPCQYLQKRFPGAGASAKVLRPVVCEVRMGLELWVGVGSGLAVGGGGCWGLHEDSVRFPGDPGGSGLPQQHKEAPRLRFPETLQTLWRA